MKEPHSPTSKTLSLISLQQHVDPEKANNHGSPTKSLHDLMAKMDITEAKQTIKEEEKQDLEQ